MKNICELCDREDVKITEHHLVPRSRRRHEAGFGPIADFCGDCHRKVHATWDNKVLAKDYNTVDINIGYAYLVYGYTHTAKIVLISDSYGSCSGCDQWEDATDEDVRQLCTSLANDAHSFDGIEEAIDWLRKAATDSAHYEWRELGEKLANKLTEKLEEIKAKGL